MTSSQILTIDNNQKLEEFGDKLKSKLEDYIKVVVGIDGPMQSGKSTVVTNYLSKRLDAKLIDLDTLIEIDEEGIIYKRKKPDLEGGRVYFADGVLNRKILANYGIEADINIYVKKMVNYGWAERSWLDKETVRDYGLDEFELENNINREIYDYHEVYDPIQNADFILEITEDFVINYGGQS